VRDAVEVHARGYVNRSNASFTDYYTGGNHGDSSLYVGYRNVCRYPRTANGTNENWGSVPGTFEMAYRHYVGRRGLTMGQTQKLLSERRPQGRNTSWGWDTVTHAK
jgi:hypothetical protein